MWQIFNVLAHRLHAPWPHKNTILRLRSIHIPQPWVSSISATCLKEIKNFYLKYEINYYWNNHFDKIFKKKKYLFWRQRCFSITSATLTYFLWISTDINNMNRGFIVLHTCLSHKHVRDIKTAISWFEAFLRGEGSKEKTFSLLKLFFWRQICALL